MRDIDNIELGKIKSGDYAKAELILFDLVEGLFGFWRGSGPLTVNGITYTGAGSLLEIDAVNAGVDLSASPLNVKLRAIPETDLSPDLLATIDSYGYKDRPVTLSFAYFDRTNGSLALTVPVWRGYVDKVDHDETVGGDYVLIGRLEPRSLDHSRTGHRTRSDADQRAMDPNDRFFEHAATVHTETLYYGKAAPGPAIPHAWLPGANQS